MKVDQTSIQGTALVIGVIKQNLAAVGAYLDTTKAEYKNFVNAVPKDHNWIELPAISSEQLQVCTVIGSRLLAVLVKAMDADSEFMVKEYWRKFTIATSDHHRPIVE